MKEEKLVKKLYDENPKKEWDRLFKNPFHKLEFDTTMHFLLKYLPKKGLILDAGGGPGRYTIELAKRGYKIVLLDFSEKNIEFAKKKINQNKLNKKIENTIEGTIINLFTFKNNTFDAVLCLGGALSHVTPEKHRKKAVSELTRVAKYNSKIFISVMGKFGVLLNSVRRWPDEININEHFHNLSVNGEDYMWHGGKAFAHFFTLEELRNLVKGKIKIIEEIGLEGLATPNEEETNRLAKSKRYPNAWKNWLKTHYKLNTHPTIVDSSLHFMIIGRKK
jgi:SAM-dependent methyltransferase